MTGAELTKKIELMGLSHNRFAELAGIKYPSLRAILKGSTAEPKEKTMQGIKAVLAKTCPHCGQYWEKSDAATGTGRRSRREK